jgi:RNA polymerase sigma-54 factor
VSEAILRNQADFFKKGPEHLRPMTLKAIGDELGLHESTISRVTTNKFMATPFGTLELKYFFNGAVGGKSGGIEFASMSVKTKIQGLVSKEGPENPLTDDQLVQMLAREGVKVARRTVSKYREELRIPGSSERKRLSRRPRTVK